MFRWLATHKAYWITPLIVFWGLLALVAWKVANTEASPFEYKLY